MVGRKGAQALPTPSEPLDLSVIEARNSHAKTKGLTQSPFGLHSLQLWFCQLPSWQQRTPLSPYFSYFPKRF